MDDNTLKQLWLDSGNEQKVEINNEKLITSINQKISNIEKLVKRRNRREITISVLMIPLFGWWLLGVPQALAKIGAAIIFLSCLLVIFRLSYTRKISVGENTASAIKFHLIESLERVKSEIKLHDSILWWYLLPFFIGVICFYYAYPVTLLNKAIYTALVAALYTYIYFMNKKVVKKKLKPLEDSIIKALNELSVEE